MSYDPGMVADGPYGNARTGPNGASAGKGSVRAARERLLAAQGQTQAPDRSRIVGLPSRPNQLVSQFSTQNQLAPESNSSRNDRSPSPQWPLPKTSEDAIDSRPGQYSRGVERGTAPQRSQRPSSYQSDEAFSPTEATTSSRPLTTSSAASTTSSFSIPDFPVPQPPMPAIQALPRRNPSLGPPPSSRRGPSSYYTQMSYVSPIAEESETRSDMIRSQHGSFASSMVIPTNVDHYYFEDDGIQFESDEEQTSPSSDQGRHSRASDHDERSNLVRQASLGRRTKPAITTIKSSGSLKGESRSNSGIKRKPVGDAEGAIGPAVGNGTPRQQSSLSSLRQSSAPVSLSSGTGLLDPSSSSLESLASENDNKSRPRGEAATRGGDIEKDLLEAQNHQSESVGRQSSLADRVGKRRPPRINVDAVREAEARGSLSTLPEMIRRATRLAAIYDRGKTASQAGSDFLEWTSREKNGTRRSGSLSDMLAAFPPPGEATPSGERTPNNRVSTRWPSAGGFPTASSGTTNEKARNRRRRCCGMPMWTFVTLLIVLLFLVAAAVVIPIVLIVIPRMRDNANATPSSGNVNNNPSSNTPIPAPKPGQCDNIIKCQNGGVAVPNNERSCNCVCINGFTGRTCATDADNGCTTMNLPGTTNNATIGSGIPRLLNDAQQNFSIPLDPPRLLAVFSNMSLSCTSENALVTFNGQSARSLHQSHGAVIDESALEQSLRIPRLEDPHADTHLMELTRRQAVGPVGTATPTSTSGPTTTNVNVKAASTSIPISRNVTVLNFARTVILLVLQESRDLDGAAKAQESLQNMFNQNRNSNSNLSPVKLGNGFKVDLSNLTLDIGNGTTLQAPPSNSTVQRL